MAQQTLTGGNGVTGQTGLESRDIINENFTEVYGIFDGLDFNPVTPPTYKRGKIFFNNDNDTLNIYDSFSDTSIQVGYESLIRVRNSTGSTILNGQAVYVSGAIGQSPSITLAQADTEIASNLIGLATHDIGNNSIGKVVVFGLANDLNTSAFSEGDRLYLSESSAGGLVSTPPASPNFVVFIGVVVNSNPTSGSIFVNPDNHIDNNNSLGTSQNSSPTTNAVKQYVDQQQLISYTVGTLPSASPAGKQIYVSDESGGAVPAFSDGANWRRVTDRSIVT